MLAKLMPRKSKQSLLYLNVRIRVKRALNKGTLQCQQIFGVTLGQLNPFSSVLASLYIAAFLELINIVPK